ncbi:uncharacterized protein LOC142159420 isoform X1 [Mixophyes fleayi]|uniref:uncharacterized protein LOC142159420 isoform X1 n=1 Tax=Mixophyes fleayi TaxID=3061075 RepID=UPI003F4E0828
MRYPVFLALVALSVPVEAESPSQLKSSVRIESIKRRGNHNYPLRMAQRGRKKSIWSYNPGHRSLAFLIAGEVAEVSPPPVDPETGMEYRCLGCCGASASVTVKTSISLELSNSVGQIVSRTEGIGALGTEPNAINDRCLGCCHKSVTPRLGVTPETREGVTGVTGRGETAQTVGRQWQPQRGRIHDPLCIPPGCNRHWRVTSSSSSEEISVIRRHQPYRRSQPLQRRTGDPCRRLGCRTALGAIPDSSSSSEED